MNHAQARGPLVLALVVALVVVTSVCLVHGNDDERLDLCGSLVAVTFGLVFALSLGPARRMAVVGLGGYRPSSPEPPAPPPKV